MAWQRHPELTSEDAQMQGPGKPNQQHSSVRIQAWGFGNMPDRERVQ